MAFCPRNGAGEFLGSTEPLGLNSGLNPLGEREEKRTFFTGVFHGG